METGRDGASRHACPHALTLGDADGSPLHEGPRTPLQNRPSPYSHASERARHLAGTFWQEARTRPGRTSADAGACAGMVAAAAVAAALLRGVLGALDGIAGLPFRLGGPAPDLALPDERGVKAVAPGGSLALGVEPHSSAGARLFFATGSAGAKLFLGGARGGGDAAGIRLFFGAGAGGEGLSTDFFFGGDGVETRPFSMDRFLSFPSPSASAVAEGWDSAVPVRLCARCTAQPATTATAS